MTFPNRKTATLHLKTCQSLQRESIVQFSPVFGSINFQVFSRTLSFWECSQNENSCHSRPCYPFETRLWSLCHWIDACIDVGPTTWFGWDVPAVSMVIKSQGHEIWARGLKLETLQGFKYITGRFQLPIGIEGSLRGTTRRSEALILNSNRTIPMVPPGICSHSAVSETCNFFPTKYSPSVGSTHPAKVSRKWRFVYIGHFIKMKKSLIHCYRVG